MLKSVVSVASRHTKGFSLDRGGLACLLRLLIFKGYSRVRSSSWASGE